ncbi:unnamed protein product [Gordionus sp. m RMFG-2023]
MNQLLIMNAQKHHEKGKAYSNVMYLVYLKNPNCYQQKFKSISTQTEDNLIDQFTQTDGRIYVTNECQTGDHDYNYLPNSLTTSLTCDHDYNYLPNSLTTSLIDQNETHVLHSNGNENHVMHSNENETHLSIYEHGVINLTTNSSYARKEIRFLCDATS